VFFKDLNPWHQLEDARSLRGKPELDRSYRELGMYRDILPGLCLGTPQLYAWRWEPQQGIFWLFLEYVESERLSRSSFQYWVEAARWAARFHAAGRDLAATQTNFLSHLDRTHYLACAEHLERNFVKFNREQQGIVRQALKDYEGFLDNLVALPRHLIHGEYFGENIMVRQANANEPIAVIDWETALVGPGHVDLVSITAGQWTLEQRQTMWRAYFEQFQLETGLSLNWDQFCRELIQVALYRALVWLGWWSNGESDQVARWLQEVVNVTSEAAIISAI
jgi:aminoglycoside phosphotransferase (APT) family kinase protein